jgi:Mlc titration factor MtfA (ptsG expression regulator)
LLRRFRRTRILRNRPLPDEMWASLLHEHPILAGFATNDLVRLRELATLFLREKLFEDPKHLELDEYQRAVIATQACLPILNLGLEWYRNWRTVVVVPDVFVHKSVEYDRAGVAHEWEEDESGESWDRGPVVLSWQDVEASGWGDGYNVVIHEAAHRLDLLDGQVNGRPELHPGMDPREWSRVFSHAYADLSRKARGRGRRRMRIDDYATESDSEFFAVASEYFFEQPQVLRGEYPEVYRLLAEFYRQDPLPRLRSRRGR